MKKSSAVVSVFAVFALAVSLAACGGASEADKSPSRIPAESTSEKSRSNAVGADSRNTEPTTDSKELREVRLMLDYAPNTNHTGFYVAEQLGYYRDAGLRVQIIEPGDNATGTMVATGKADFGVSYQEDVTYALTAEEKLPIKTVAAIIQHNTSGFVSLKSAGIQSPKDFEGKTYAGWGAPSEEAVIDAVMKKDGADIGKLRIVGADGSGFASLSADSGENKVNLQWEFYGWAYIKGEMEGYELNYLPLRELDERLDYYTPVIISNEEKISKDPETVKAFIQATKKGYEYAIQNPDEAAQILHDTALPETDPGFLKRSQEYLSSQYALDAASWGVMQDSVWDGYTEFMLEAGLIQKKIPAAEQYTNEFVAAEE